MHALVDSMEHIICASVSLVSKYVSACVNTCVRTGLKDDRHVRGVEEFDGVFSLLSSVFSVSDWEIHTPS